ncbi:MAG: SpoIIE family protein phosphatase, partial [Candidatus Latescibacterota bacterium]
VTEADGAGGEMYGEERLEEVLREVLQKSANDILSDVLGSIEAFSAGIEQSDDISIIVVQLKGLGMVSAE